MALGGSKGSARDASCLVSLRRHAERKAVFLHYLNEPVVRGMTWETGGDLLLLLTIVSPLSLPSERVNFDRSRGF